MSLDIYLKNNTRLPNNIRFEKKACQTMNTLGCEAAWVEVSFVGKTAIQKLNFEYRNKNKLTDVLSFPLESKKPPGGMPWHMGEIIICMPVARAQSKELSVSLNDQVLRLFVHGLVHLKGFDHELSEKDFAYFRKLEIKALKSVMKTPIPL